MLSRRVVELAEDKQANEIVLLDIRKQSTIADYFVICSADNERQLQAIAEHIDATIHRDFAEPRIEGRQHRWVILDYYDVIVHIFSNEQREYYQLERLWSKATPILVVQ
ncbi:MAG: ribosome silencing factor [Chloroflexaceae bacterium]|nr:ribosome silencing factor [Chloroflexaceae bacterium]